MTQSWSFEVPGRPVPKARPRVYQGHAVTPATTVAYEALVATCARQAGVQATGPVRVVIELYPPDRRRADIDNIAKAILDGLVQGGCVPGDHWEVVRGLAVEVVRVDRANPRAVVIIQTMNGGV